MHKLLAALQIRSIRATAVAVIISALLQNGSEAAPASVEHWAFQQPRAAKPPVDPTGWSRTLVDTFVRAQLTARGVQPSMQADRQTLIRRVFLDLTGLPPSPDEVERFLSDPSPDAYDRVVNRLLGSPAFGERWGRHWLDLARYADSAGYEADPARPAWLYRNWVINAINRNQAFDEFVIEQIAGDLLPEADLDSLIATGFHGVGPWTEGLRHLNVMNRLTTTGAVFLGLTVECAQCHDHKTDPLSQREYYEFYAFFDHARLRKIEVEVPDESEEARAHRVELDTMRNRYETTEKHYSDSLDEWIASLDDETHAKLIRRAREALKKPAEERSDHEWSHIILGRRKLDTEQFELRKKLLEREKEYVHTVTTALVMEQRPKVTRIFQLGNHATPGETVTPGVPAFLPPLTARNAEQADRLDLARWLVSPDNPLTPRVTVNRIWQRYFGIGLVETEGDFGVQTPPASHPGLLDWLAREFVRSGWNLKHIHKLIVHSATYRQSSRIRPKLLEDDPQNRWLARQSRMRLESEIIRDGFLHASGLLTRQVGGPSVHPYQPPGLADFGGLKKKWVESTGADKYRRGMYTFLWRKDVYPLLVLFDLPDSDLPCGRRERSTTPVQALSLLNDPALVECAQSLGARVVQESRSSVEERLDTLFAICLGRPASPNERQLILDLVTAERAELERNPQSVQKIAGDNRPSEVHVTDHAVWTIAARVVLNLDEFITRE